MAATVLRPTITPTKAERPVIADLCFRLRPSAFAMTCFRWDIFPVGGGSAETFACRGSCRNGPDASRRATQRGTRIEHRATMATRAPTPARRPSAIEIGPVLPDHPCDARHLLAHRGGRRDGERVVAGGGRRLDGGLGGDFAQPRRPRRDDRRGRAARGGERAGAGEPRPPPALSAALL